jgi:LuxR family transcriptional regulator, maltose regulon positive regulatory protein
VKSHQRAVYRKLNVQHRNAAVSRARELDLL